MLIQLVNSLPHPITRFIKTNYQRFTSILWILKGKPAPPPHIIKVRAIRKLANLYNISTLVETGTYMGDMISSIKNTFSRIYSIELDDK